MVRCIVPGYLNSIFFFYYFVLYYYWIYITCLPSAWLDIKLLFRFAMATYDLILNPYHVCEIKKKYFYYWCIRNYKIVYAKLNGYWNCAWMPLRNGAHLPSAPQRAATWWPISALNNTRLFSALKIEWVLHHTTPVVVLENRVDLTPKSDRDNPTKVIRITFSMSIWRLLLQCCQHHTYSNLPLNIIHYFNITLLIF